MLLSLVVAPKHCAPFRLGLSDHIDDVVGKIEIILVNRLEIDQFPIVKGLPAKFLMNIKHSHGPPLLPQLGA